MTRRSRNQRQPNTSSKELMPWDEELAKAAEKAASKELSGSGGEFFTLAGGVLSWQDTPIKGNQMLVVILASVFENVLYQGKYDPDNPTPPTCFAFAEDEEDLRPHQTVVDAGQNQNSACEGCEHNEWGSAEVGRGKGCRNTRRLAMIPAGTISKNNEIELFEDPHQLEDAQIGYLKLPVTSVKGYANYVRQTAVAVQRPLYGVVTLVSVVPDAKTQFKVEFECVDKLGSEMREVITTRVGEAESLIDFPYQLNFDDAIDTSSKHTAARTTNRTARTSRKSRKY